MARTLALFAVSAALLATAWLALPRDGVGLGEVLPMIALALVPTLAVALRRGQATVVGTGFGATLLAVSFAFGLPFADARPADSQRDFFGPALAAVRDGLRDFYETRIPFDPVSHWQMGGLVLLAVFGFLAVTGALVAARRPLAAGGALLVGVTWPATMAAVWVPGVRPLTHGALTLLALLAFLFLLRADRPVPRGVAHAGGFAVLLVVAALAASTSDAVAKPAFLRWERWDLYDRPAPPVGVRYVWDANYDGIRFPKKKTVVLRIKVPDSKRSLYWRATTLDDYDGSTWKESLDLAPPRETDVVDVDPEDALLPKDARDERKWIRQEVTVEALAENRLIGSGQPVRWEPGTSAPVRPATNGTVLLPDALDRGQRYTVWSYIPDVTAKDLASVEGDYGRELDRYLIFGDDLELPDFATPRRDAVMRELVVGEGGWDSWNLGYHEEVYEQARRVVGRAQSPYAAAVAIETWLRSEGGFVYDEQPPPAGSQRPLPYFLEVTKRGYCQQFAGAMAVMLRLLGIPTRVAAGFTSGEYDAAKREWTVTDHNAHTWVEAYFPGYGWLPFDPTPGRGELSARYSAVSPEFDPSGAVAAFAGSEILNGIDLGAGRSGREALGEREGAAARSPGGGAAGAGRDAGGTLLLPALLVISVGVLLIVGVKSGRRALRFARRDPRARASACRRDLVGFLVDQRFEIPTGATLADVAALVERTFRIDAGPFARSVGEARFGPPAATERAARRARRELRALRRRLRGELTLASRVRGALSLRSLSL